MINFHSCLCSSSRRAYRGLAHSPRRGDCQVERGSTEQGTYAGLDTEILSDLRRTEATGGVYGVCAALIMTHTRV